MSKPPLGEAAGATDNALEERKEACSRFQYGLFGLSVHLGLCQFSLQDPRDRSRPDPLAQPFPAVEQRLDVVQVVLRIVPLSTRVAPQVFLDRLIRRAGP